MWHFRNIREVRAAATAAREVAEKEARAVSPCVFARGTNLSTARRGGEPCKPREEADAPGWKRTWKEIVELVTEVEANHPHVGEVYLSGGYDSADSPHARWVDGNYEPWVSSWNVLLWERDQLENR